MRPVDPPPPHRSTLRHALVWCLKIGVSAGLLYVLFTRIDAGNLWASISGASAVWIAAALGLYLLMLLISTWRWRLLLRAQDIDVGYGTLINSFLVAMFANNFLPSNIGGDVIRIRDTARAAGSKTLATAVVLADRGIGVLGLAFVAASGSTLAASRSEAVGPIGPSLLWGGLFIVFLICVLILAMPQKLAVLVRPLRRFHPEWVDQRIALITGALQKFRKSPGAMAAGFAGGIAVQGTLVAFYWAVATAIHLAVPMGHLAILVPVSFIVQMMPLSLNGLGIREWTFVGYLTRVGVQKEQAVALSLVAAALVVLFSMSGAAAYLTRRRRDPATVAAE